MMTGPLVTSIFNVNSVKKLLSSVNYFLLNEYGSFTVQWKGQKLAGKILLTWTKSLLVRSFLDQKPQQNPHQNPHQNHQLIADPRCLFFWQIASVDEEWNPKENNRVYFFFENWKLAPTGNWATHCKVGFDKTLTPVNWPPTDPLTDPPTASL